MVTPKNNHVNIRLSMKQRGRPRKDLTDDPDLNARRKKNREAQKLFRTRQENPTNNAKKARESETTTSRIMSVFTSLVDDLMQSELIKQDKHLTSKIHAALETMLALVTHSYSPEASVDEVQLLPLDAVRNGRDQRSNAHSNAALPSRGEKQSRNPPIKINTQPEELPKSDTLFSMVTLPNIDADLRPWPNTLKNEWESHLTRDSMKSYEIGMGMLENSFGIQIVRSAMESAYKILLNPNEWTMSIFAFALRRFSREQILQNFRWSLGPGSHTLANLVTSSFEESESSYRKDLFYDWTPADSMAKNTSNNGDLCNADEVVEFIQQRCYGNLNDDTFWIFYHPNQKGKIAKGRTPTELGWHSGRKIAPTNHNDWAIGDRELQRTNIKMISKSLLLSNITKLGMCCGSGPAFRKDFLEQALLASVVSGPMGAQDVLGDHGI